MVASGGERERRKQRKEGSGGCVVVHLLDVAPAGAAIS
jgi:hypothetical protein